jgi:PHD/YefM family antitoxin component YafN of YafNO toxin-antitoxin module
MNALSATEIKRRGFGIIDPLLEKGPVYVIRNNRPRYVVLSEADYSSMAERAAATPRPKRKFTVPDFDKRIKEIWGDRSFSKKETDELNRWEREWEGV